MVLPVRISVQELSEVEDSLVDFAHIVKGDGHLRQDVARVLKAKFQYE
jgi:hypothetical protein